MTEIRVTAIVVTHQPDLPILGRVIDAILPQLTHIVVVDNGSDANMAEWVKVLGQKNIHVILLGANLGIAVAQNAGIQWARQHGATFVLLMDQDSIPDKNMVSKLLIAYWRLTKEEGRKVSAIGPRFRDSNSGHLSQHVCFKQLGAGRANCRPNDYAVPTDFLIASGSLIEMDVLGAVGDMDEGLFIDHVDTEWILRARAKGYRAWGHCDAIMTHSLGENRIRIWFLRWRDIPFHKPFRYYYVFRNSLVLQRRGYPCWAWRRVDAIRLVQFLFFMTIFHPDRFQVLRMMALGFVDGLKGVSGPLQK